MTLTEPTAQELLFLEAETLGVSILGNDLAALLDAIHDNESKLMFLRHKVQRSIAGITHGE